MVAEMAQQTGQRRVAVVGCGSPGLTTAREIQRRGFDVTIYLDALVRDFLMFGGKIVIRKFATPRDLMSLTEPIVVNCTGLGSFTLFDDKALVPIKSARADQGTAHGDGAAAGSDLLRGQAHGERRRRDDELAIRRHRGRQPAGSGQLVARARRHSAHGSLVPRRHRPLLPSRRSSMPNPEITIEVAFL
jgi:hypothetical protein